MKPFDATTLAHEARIASLELQLAEAVARIEALEAAPPKVRQPPKIMDRAEHAQRKRIREIASEVAARYGVTVERMRSHDKRRVFMAPRWEAWALCQDERFSTPVIGRYFGGRDHTTILHGIRQHRGKTNAPG